MLQLFLLICFTELGASLYCYSILDIHVSFIIYVHKRLFIACRLPSLLIWIISKHLWLYRAWSNCKADHQRCTLFYCWRAVLNQALHCNLFNAVQRIQCGEFHYQSIPSTFINQRRRKKTLLLAQIWCPLILQSLMSEAISIRAYLWLPYFTKRPNLAWQLDRSDFNSAHPVWPTSDRERSQSVLIFSGDKSASCPDKEMGSARGVKAVTKPGSNCC